MDNLNSIDFALDPRHPPSFLLDWEITMKCNLDCSYCFTGLDGGHDNTTEHPPLEKCLESIDFMYQYVDEYMKFKKTYQKKVVLNVYGGESIFHPDIVTILENCRSKYLQYQDKWHLTISCTTNGIAGSNLWSKLVPLIDDFTLSYHTESLPKQKEQFKKNLLALKQSDKTFKCLIVMHNSIDNWNDAELMIDFCKSNNIKYLPRALDNSEITWSYNNEQYSKFKQFWIAQSPKAQQDTIKSKMHLIGAGDSVHSVAEGRACCGGRNMMLNSDLKSSCAYIPHQNFKGWACSVNWFFLFVKQLTGEVFTNKDCKMSTTGKIESLGNMNNYSVILETLRSQLQNNKMPVIICDKTVCRCGICAPKVKDINNFTSVMMRYSTKNIFEDPTNGN